MVIEYNNRYAGEEKVNIGGGKRVEGMRAEEGRKKGKIGEGVSD